MTNSYLINLFRGEPLKNCSEDRFPDILARQYQVVQTVGYPNLRHIRAKTFAIFLNILHVKHPIACVMLGCPRVAIDALVGMHQQHRHFDFGFLLQETLSLVNG